ncbi:uncharacterized protein LOC131597570 [Vicia villosa]|uniref:uncharacterized protein LOC131597570 n=1 Tax=Vicia villosa TaxID=3911 RepID=UPI00273BD384|nr:uncharacterized protein LOC131597570 [Vicia villosa]
MKNEIAKVTNFQEGQLPFKYLGVPVTGKKLPIRHYMSLIDRGFEGSCKAPVAWKKVCTPKSYGGPNIIDLDLWNKTNMIRLLWDINGKADSLWVRWIQAYYLKNKHRMEIEIKPHYSWIMKAVLDQRNCVNDINDWEDIMNTNNFNISKVYKKLQLSDQKVEWRNLMYGNTARPRACFIIWLACHGRLSTKDSLYKFGLIDNKGCCFCLIEEFADHLFFECPHTRKI